MWASGIYVNALRRSGIVLFRIRKSLTGFAGPSGSLMSCPHIIKNWTFVIAGTERPSELPYSQHHGSAEENPGRAQKGGDCRT
jgi:hypothetical protein